MACPAGTAGIGGTIMNARERRTTLIALGMLLPNFLGFLVFVAGPVVFSFIMAFTNWDLTLHNRFSTDQVMFVGFDNFKALFGGAQWRYFSKYFYNTVYLMMAIPVGIALSLVAALLLNSEIKPLSQRTGKKERLIVPLITIIGAGAMYMLGAHPGGIFLFLLTGGLVLLTLVVKQTAFRTMFYLPHFTSGVAIYILWKAMYRPETGPINNILQPILNSIASLVSSTPAVLWQSIGWLFVLAMAGFFLWSVVTLVIKFKDEDIGVIGLIFSILGIAIFFTLIGSLGYVTGNLPKWVAEQGGLFAPSWLVSVQWAKPALLIMAVFFAMGSNNMLLYLAALNNVPTHLYDAAAIDGANAWQRFWNVTWPQLAPTTFFIVIMATIYGLQGGFEQARVMTEGGPAGSTTTLSYYLYLTGFDDFRLGMASAIAWTMFALIFTMTMVNWRYGNRMVND
ncbi:MAG: ABC transporter permease subunit [Chitinivibrionales bacterium]|nr:ABC transporter permease subunit [Chitinivibrionales bacterium]MBD3394881.1 ABC transporter permease subunit [Chitinivibrionales bacterium]